MENIENMKKQIDSLQEKIARLEFRLNALEKINALVNLSGQLDVVIDGVMDLVLKLIDAEYILIVLVNKETNELRFRVNNLDWKDEEKKQKQKMLEEKKVGKEETISEIFSKEDPIVGNAVPINMKFEKEVENRINFSIRNFLCVPLRTKNQKLGIIEIFNKKPNNSSFSKEDMDLIDSLSKEIAVVIENADLFNKLDAKIIELNNFIRATEVVNSTLGLELLLDVVMQLAMRMMSAEASFLFLMDEQKNQLYYESTQGEIGKPVVRTYLSKGEGIVGWVARTGRTALIPDVSKDLRFFGKVDHVSGSQTKSILCVPLKIADRIIGVAEVVNKKGEESFTYADLVLFRSLASQSALAIEKARLYQKLSALFIAIIRSLTAAIDAKHPYTRGHSERVTRYALLIAKELKFSDEQKKKVQLAGLLHDVGKIGVPDVVLEKEGNLSKEDWIAMKKHPAIGAEILEPIEELRMLIPIIRHHHERFDGMGYPDGLREERIPLISRIISVADAFDSMTSERPYRKKKSDEVALMQIKNNEKSQFDTKCAEAFIEGYRKEFIIKE